LIVRCSILPDLIARSVRECIAVIIIAIWGIQLMIKIILAILIVIVRVVKVIFVFVVKISRWNSIITILTLISWWKLICMSSAVVVVVASMIWIIVRTNVWIYACLWIMIVLSYGITWLRNSMARQECRRLRRWHWPLAQYRRRVLLWLAGWVY